MTVGATTLPTLQKFNVSFRNTGKIIDKLPEVLRLEELAVEQPGGNEGQPSLGPLCVAFEAPSFKGGDADAFLLEVHTMNHLIRDCTEIFILIITCPLYGSDKATRVARATTSHNPCVCLAAFLLW